MSKRYKSRLENYLYSLTTILYKIRSLISYFRYRFVVKHHLIRTGLRPGWWDTDTRMLYGMMALLAEFVEKEKPEDTIDWDYDSDHAKTRDEFTTIYKWWKEYPMRQEEISDLLSKWHDCKFGKEGIGKYSGDWVAKLNEPDTEEARKLFSDLSIAEEKLENDEQDMLTRLVKIRRYLWT